jgi:hypothetical protein
MTLSTRQWPKLRKPPQGQKNPKLRVSYVNILNLKSDPIFLALEIRPEAGWMGHALSLTGETAIALVEDGLGKQPSWWGLPLLACFLGHVAAWTQELGRGQRERRRVMGKGADTWQLQEEAVTTKANNVRPHRLSWLPSPPGPDGELKPCGTDHLCNSGLPCCISIRTWPKQFVGAHGACMPCTIWGLANKVNPNIS